MLSTLFRIRVTSYAVRGFPVSDPKFLTKVLSLHCGPLLVFLHSVGFDKYIHHYSTSQNSFTSLKVLCAPPSHSAPTQPLATADPFYCLHSCLSRMADSQNHTLPYFYNWLLSLSMGIGGSSVSFHALIAYLFLVLNNILLS